MGKDGWNDATPQKDTSANAFAPFAPRTQGILLSWPWWIDCASPSCPLPRKSQAPKTQKDAESRTRNENGTRSLASPRARLSLTGPRPATRPSTVSVSSAALALASPCQIVFVGQGPTSRPQELGTAGLPPILPTGRPILHHIAEADRPWTHLVLKTKRPPKKFIHWSLLAPSRREETPQFNHLNRVCP